MKTFKKLALLALTTITLISCSKKEDIENPTFSIKLDHTANIGDVLYDGAGNGYILNKLKYFVTDIELHKSNGEKVVIDNEVGATIIDLENAVEGGAIVYNDIVGVEKGAYTSVSFKIGVSDEIFNQGEEAQGRILELANENGGDMIWSWTTGYIFAKIEGELTGTTGSNSEDDGHGDHAHKTTSTYKVAHNGVDHDIEGTAFMRHVANSGSDDTRTDRVRTITLDFNGQEVVVGNVDSSIHLKVDVAKFLDGSEKIDIVATDPGAMTASTTEIADNLEDVFSFDHKH
ncbi:hypothetical protein AXE80_06390 [Wenyingzhuangia fucanilytica]|uniref:Copper-binding protein MbnP-like domain-containing protein n=1 Tax=Wenyingzhuangia fucanilytica TaxID=1790137 RepID=A0A1B1Y597_9FLAO|nr:MbnP family protein [Wenyingzhuangia fucanilytica]ANW95930.1 hypothetical protein AXE80_06390 [Wenyingzhuangia fucanilytica]